MVEIEIREKMKTYLRQVAFNVMGERNHEKKIEKFMNSDNISKQLDEITDLNTSDILELGRIYLNSQGITKVNYTYLEQLKNYSLSEIKAENQQVKK